jgi:hypothetical protein
VTLLCWSQAEWIIYCVFRGNPSKNHVIVIFLCRIWVVFMDRSLSWDITPYSLLKFNQRFRGTCWLTFSGPHSIIFQKIELLITFLLRNYEGHLYHKLKDIAWWFGVHFINNDKLISVFEELAACIFLLSSPEDGDSRFLWNIDIYLAGCMARHPRRQLSSVYLYFVCCLRGTW